MSDEYTKAWWRGSFPMWLVVVLLSLISYFLVRYVSEMDRRLLALESASVSFATRAELKPLVDKTAEHGVKVAVLEQQVRVFEQAVDDLRISNRDVVKAINDLRLQMFEERK